MATLHMCAPGKSTDTLTLANTWALFKKVHKTVIAWDASCEGSWEVGIKGCRKTSILLSGL